MSNWNSMKKYQPCQLRTELQLGMTLSVVSMILSGWEVSWLLTLKTRSASDLKKKLTKIYTLLIFWNLRIFIKLKIPNLCGLLKQPQTIVGGQCLFNSSCYVYENNRLENYCEQEGQCTVDITNQEMGFITKTNYYSDLINFDLLNKKIFKIFIIFQRTN